MDSLQTIKSRLKAVKNVGQITKAMEVVAATKMRRAQETALNSRPYAFEALELLQRLAVSVGDKLPLSTQREIKNTLVVIIASDRGLAGSFNSQVFRQAETFFANDPYHSSPQHNYLLLPVGKKAINYVAKKSYDQLPAWEDFGDITTPTEIKPLVSSLVADFDSGRVDRVVTISTNFRTALKQEPLLRQILPINPELIAQTVKDIVPESGRYAGVGRWDKPFDQVAASAEVEYIFEPSPSAVLSALVPHLVEMQFYHLFLEAKASEHSARRVAMKTASDNATELADSLTIDFNKARQVGITGELMEITSTMMTLE